MTIATMRFLDTWAGGPVCVLLSFLLRLKRAVSSGPRASKKVKRVLIMKYFGMGSILLSSPLFRTIREEYRGVRIGFLTFSQNREICECLSPADDYYYIRTRNIMAFLRDLFASLREIRRKRYDMVIDMEFFSNFSMIVSVLSGARRRVGYYARRAGRENLLTTPVYFNQRRHVTDVFLSLTGLDPGIRRSRTVGLPSLCISQKNDDGGDTVYSLCGIGHNGRRRPPIIIINANAGELCRERRWPGEYFIDLSEKLLKGTGSILLFIGGEEDRIYVDDLVSSLRRKGNSDGRVFDISGKLSIKGLITILSGCDLLITNDSGPLHLAACAGARTASFFGPETPSLYGPQGEGHLIFYKGMYCSPCLNVYNAKTVSCNGDNRCLTSIHPEEAYRAIRKRFPDIWRT